MGEYVDEAERMEDIMWKRGVVWHATWGAMNRARRGHGIVRVGRNGRLEEWIWMFVDGLWKLLLLRMGLKSGVIKRLRWRILTEAERLIIRDDFVINLPRTVTYWEDVHTTRLLHKLQRQQRQ